jgi:hypothetical protein
MKATTIRRQQGLTVINMMVGVMALGLVLAGLLKLVGA